MKACIMFTDVKSSSKLWAAHPKEMLKMLTKHENVIRAAAAKQKGFIIKTIGDAVMISFPTLEKGVLCAMEIQQKLKSNPLKFSKSDDLLQIRIGIAYGPVQVKGILVQNVKLKDVFGTTVNLASRMESKVSLVGGFGILADNIPKKVMDLIEKYCTVNNIVFKYNCEQAGVRSTRLLNSCVDVGVLHVEDGNEHKTISCILK
jgi:class 3 adenylate cyclase